MQRSTWNGVEFSRTRAFRGLAIGVLLLASVSGLVRLGPISRADAQSPVPTAAPAPGTPTASAPDAGGSIALEAFRPQPRLRVPQTPLEQASQPVVDVHAHFHVRFRGSREQLDEFVRVMDRNRIAVCVSLDGRLPDGFAEQRDFLWKHHADRFVIFANLDWQGAGKPDDWSSWACIA